MRTAFIESRDSRATAGFDQQQFNSLLSLNTGCTFETANDTDDVPLFEAEPGLYPCLLINGGSMLFSLKVITRQSCLMGYTLSTVTQVKSSCYKNSQEDKLSQRMFLFSLNPREYRSIVENS